MRRALSILTLIFLVMLFSGCIAFVQSEVAVFHQLGEISTPVKYIFVPLEGQQISLEYKAYKELVRQQLSKYQYIEVASSEMADVVIAFSYGIDSGRGSFESVPIIGQTGISTSTTTAGVTTYTPTYGVVGSEVVSTTVFNRGFWLYIADAKLSSTNKLNILYEGSVKSSGSSSQLAAVMPALVEALFKEFPGKSGETRTEFLFRQ
ncbi:MAG: DUF4136 domain-containing protein [Alphaproteobacteria bacterium]|uniref:DUF4136 domain-containing protein n=1 Tax=Candidatus Nitrobium versatile TaxID=2884831 RepID=A0A953LW04_9BACT|nr:DUF4136 domain-containing protein [Candidatus Nitrobium versatile]